MAQSDGLGTEEEETYVVRAWKLRERGMEAVGQCNHGERTRANGRRENRVEGEMINDGETEPERNETTLFAPVYSQYLLR